MDHYREDWRACARPRQTTRGTAPPLPHAAGFARDRGQGHGGDRFNTVASLIARSQALGCLGGVTPILIAPAVAADPPPIGPPCATPAGGPTITPAGGPAALRALGAGGMALARVAAQMMQFALFLDAARVLSTADFGVFSLAYAIIVGITVLAEAGWREWVLCAVSPRQIDEAGGAALLTGGLLVMPGLGLLELGHWLGADPALVGVGALLLPWIVARPLVSVQLGVLARAGRLAHIAAVQTVCEAAGLIAGVALLAQGAGLAALAWAKLALLAVELAGYTTGVGRLGLALPGRRNRRAMLRFSWQITAARVLTYLQGNLTTLVIGAVFSPALVGVYRAAARLGGTAQEVIREPARMVGWSWLRAASDHDGADAQRPRLIAAAHQFLDLAVTLGAGLLLLLALESGAIVRVLLGGKWIGAAGLVALLALGMIARLPQALAEPLFPLLGKAWLTRRLAVQTAVLGLVCFCLALPFGVVMVALADLVAALLMLGPLVFYLLAEGGLRPAPVLRPLVLALLSGLGAAVLARQLPPAGGAHGLGALALLVRDVGALGLTYAAIQIGLRRIAPLVRLHLAPPVTETAG
jgi:O-antigen/teichoic acid export membrane protein